MHCLKFLVKGFNDILIINITVMKHLRIIIYYIKSILLKIRKEYKMAEISYKWQQKNKHNMTVVANHVNQALFPVNNVTVGKYTYGALHVVPYNNINEGANLTIGNFCSIAKGVKFLLGGNHDYKRLSTYPFNLYTDLEGVSISKGDIIVEDDVWVGENVLVLSGVRIRQGAVVAANTVVSKDIEPYEIVGGNPMKHFKYRFPENVRNKLVTINFSEVTIDTVKQLRELFAKHIDESDVDELISSLKMYCG